MKKKTVVAVICIAAAASVLLAVLAVVGYLLPYLSAQTAMPENGAMILTRQENGSLLLSWTQRAQTDQYLVEVTKQGETLFEQHVQQQLQCSLPELPLEEELTIRVYAVGAYRFPLEKKARLRKGEMPLEATGILQPPAVEELVRTNDTDADTVNLRFAMQEGMVCQVYHVQDGGTLELLQTSDRGEITLAFGKGQAFPVPAYGEELTFALACSRTLPGIELRGSANERVTVCREDLLGDKIGLEVVDEGNNSYMLYWNETKGEYQLLQLWDPDTESWKTVKQYSHADMPAYDTGHLARYSQFRFRVVGVGGQTLSGSEFSTEPEEVTLTTGASVVYSTIWPIQKLDIYKDTEQKEIVGTAPEGKAYCVKDMQNGMFLIRYEGEKLGYVDCNYCMINLPEFIGDKCLYNITNSYSSMYMIHNYGIPTVTEEVTVGYEKIQLSEGEYLVPLLYPAALKLEKAALAAIEKGYKLKIYDSFRPRKATLELYDIASDLLNDPLPMEDYYGEPGENASLTGDPEEIPVTYSMLMTDNGRYKLSYFLAKGGSRHNLGVALDLTIVKLSNHAELAMQTQMHDLSWFSETGRNNANAKTLASIMKDAGFAGLVSEWWHFQDNDAKEDLQLTNYMSAGVTPECWMADDYGWRYRRANGRYYKDCTQTIGGVEYTFDTSGYVVDGNNQ